MSPMDESVILSANNSPWSPVPLIPAVVISSIHSCVFFTCISENSNLNPEGCTYFFLDDTSWDTLSYRDVESENLLLLLASTDDKRASKYKRHLDYSVK